MMGSHSKKRIHNLRFLELVFGPLSIIIMRRIVTILPAVLSLAIAIDVCADLPVPSSNQDLASSVLESSHVDDRDVYIVTSKIDGRLPKTGPLRHASIAICPKGVSPIVYRNGVPVSNCRECKLYGTRVMERGFKSDSLRINAKATKVCGISASTVEQRMRSHRQMNVPLLHDCRHHVIQVLGLRNRRGRLKPAFTVQ